MLVLLDDPHRHRQHQQRQEDENNHYDARRFHRRAPVGDLCAALPAATSYAAVVVRGRLKGFKVVGRVENLYEAAIMVILMYVTITAVGVLEHMLLKFRSGQLNSSRTR